MIRDLAVIAPVVMGSFCLLAVCAVYLRSQSFRLDGALLALCGVVLLAISYWQVGKDRGEQDLARRLDALALLEGSIAEIAADQARLAAVVAAQAPPAAGRIANGAPGASPAVAPGAPSAVASSAPQVLEIEVLGGVSGEELDAIVAWIRQVYATDRSSHIVVEPVMPLTSADPAGQRKRLMDEAGRVIDHVFEELNQRVDIVTLVSEPVPGPRLRLTRSEA
jgi:hypothetical protein